MTEAEWLSGTDPVALLAALEGRGTDRQFRLFAVAACYLCRKPGRAAARKPRKRAIFESVVNYVDGTGTLDEVLTHWSGGDGAWPQRPFVWAHTFAQDAVRRERGYSDFPQPAELVPLVRCVFGSPFRPVAFDPAWRTDTAQALARQMYDSREFGALPILADALQDAGCENEHVLTHCRDATQVHVRGCWVCDAVLGRA
jgi:hypothetical protein